MRIFLTGGTGFIGSHLLRKALAAGHEVVALRRPGAKARILLKQEPQWVEGSLAEDWTEALSRCEAFIHLAAYGVADGAHDWEGCFQTNVIESLRLWRQAVNSGIRRFLIVGSCFEYGRSGEGYDFIPVSAPLEPTTAYGASKAAASMAAMGLAVEKQLQLVIARPFHVYGEGEAAGRFWPSLVSAALSGNDLPMTRGTQVRDFQPVEEAAESLLKSLVNPLAKPGTPKLMNLGSGNPKTLHSFAENEWDKFRAKGKIIRGKIPLRENEVMRYVPDLNS